MSTSQSKFLKWLTVVLLPFVLTSGYTIIKDLIEGRQVRETVEQNANFIQEIHKYYMTTQDFYDFFDRYNELQNAKIEGNTDKIQRVEKELDDFRNQFGIKTRNGQTD